MVSITSRAFASWQMDKPGLRSALSIAVPEAAVAVEEWLERTAYSKPSSGVPAHITISFPFVPAAAITDRCWTT